MSAMLLLGVLVVLPFALRAFARERLSHRERFEHDARRVVRAAARNGRGAEAQRYVDAKRKTTFGARR